MLTYSIRRILLFVPVLFVVLFITFTLGFYAPGDPLEIQFGQDFDPDPVILARLRSLYGLDRPFYVQFGDYIWKLVHGDMGKSIKPGPKREIWDKIKGAFPISAQLGAAAGVLLVLTAIPLGVLAAAKQNTWIDYLIVTGSIAASSILPNAQFPVKGLRWLNARYVLGRVNPETTSAIRSVTPAPGGLPTSKVQPSTWTAPLAS